MTESEWLSCADPGPMLAFMKGTASDRKLRLFGVACCRSIWRMTPDERSQRVVKVAEGFLEAQVRWEELQDAARVAPVYHGSVADPGIHPFACDAVASLSLGAWWTAYHTSSYARSAIQQSAFMENQPDPGVHINAYAAATEEAKKQAALCRDIYGNPFLPVVIDPTRRTPTVLSLAQAAYDDRLLPAGTLDPDRLAVLADALEDAGCTDNDILSHLRGPGPHVRGCWVVDLILDKE